MTSCNIFRVNLSIFIIFTLIASPFSLAYTSEESGAISEEYDFLDQDKSSELTTKVVGGDSVSPGEFPYQVFIEKIYNSTKIYKCGGTIYSSLFIITAAHCLYFNELDEFAPPRKIWVTAGTHDLVSSFPDIKKYEQVVQAQEIFPHENFHFKKQYKDKENSSFSSFPLFDIGLIKLKTPLQFNERVSPISLPGSKKFILRGNGTVTGWGRPDANGRWTKQMRKAEIPLVEYKECSKVFKAAAVINEDMFCTGSKGGRVTPCNGDSGGPIVCNDDKGNGTKVLCGIASFGAKNCANYSVYTRVSSYLQWICNIAGEQ